MDHIKTMSDPVVLAEEDRRFAMDASRRISGCIRIELSGGKGLTAVSVDNIRFFPRGEYVYKLIFAGSGQDKPFYHIAGNISLSAYGRGEASLCINPADLDGTGTKLSDLPAVLIAAMSTVNSDEALHPVLRGTLPSSPADQTEAGDVSDSMAAVHEEKSEEGKSEASPGMKNISSKAIRTGSAGDPVSDESVSRKTAGNMAAAARGESAPEAQHTEYRMQQSTQSAHGDTQRQIYRQRQNTHAVPDSFRKAMAAEPVRSPRAEAYYAGISSHSSAAGDTAGRDSDVSADSSRSFSASGTSENIPHNNNISSDHRDPAAAGPAQENIEAASGHIPGHSPDTGSDAPPETVTSVVTAAAPAENDQPSHRDCDPDCSGIILKNCVDLAVSCSAAQDIIPFDRNFADASWKKITDTSLFPLVSPGSTEPMMKYGHFIFGWCGTHYLIGVPGRFLPEEQPDSGRSGFVYWQPIAGMPEESHDASLTLEERRKDIYGYWIAPVNRSTGHIEEMPLIEN